MSASDDKSVKKGRAVEPSPGAFSMRNMRPEQLGTSPDLRAGTEEKLGMVEQMVGRNEWGGISKTLEEDSRAGRLSPTLALLYALALKESDPQARDADQKAIEAMADLLGISRQSPLALVLGKRLTRKRNWTETPAPSRGVSFLVLVGGLGLGLLVGWVVTLYMF